jgi:glycosyltransferase involved in cell wall biosynthesis
MKVAQIIESTLGGTGRHVLDIIDGLYNRGVDKIHLIHSLNRADATYLNRLKHSRPWLTTYEVRMYREISPIADMAAAWQIATYLKHKGSFDVVHVHSSKAGAVGSLAARLVGVPRIVFTPNAFVSFGTSGFRGWLYLQFERLCGQLAHRVVAVSNEEQAYALVQGIASMSRLSVIPNGIIPPDLSVYSTARSRLRAEWGIAENTRLIGSIGRLTAQKDPLLFVEVAARRALRFTANEEMYVMGGTGELENEVKTLIAKRGLEGRVMPIGFRTDMDAVLSSLDVYVLHSRYEGMPLTVLEAMGHALSVVSTKVSGVAEPLQGGGILVEPGDAAALDNALDQLIEPIVREAMGKSNRTRLEANYSVTSMIDSLLQVYSIGQLSDTYSVDNLGFLQPK